MPQNVRPLEDRLLVEPIEEESQTASGIILPETAKEKPQEGRIMAAGPGRLNENGQRLPMEVSEGDKVLFARYAGTEIKLGEKDLLIMRESDILALVAE
jgi:chaperonin GroES